MGMPTIPSLSFVPNQESAFAVFEGRNRLTPTRIEDTNLNPVLHLMGQEHRETTNPTLILGR